MSPLKIHPKYVKKQIIQGSLMKKDYLGKCPKCNKSLSSSNRKLKNKDVNILSLALLFGDVSFKKNKKASCDLCGSRLRK